MVIEFAALAGLACKIIEVWIAYNEGKQKYLDRELQRELQRERHRHEVMINNYRKSKNNISSNMVDIDKSLLDRLTMEAALLSTMGFDIIYETVKNGYGLALIISDDLTLAFWILPSYPNDSPQVYIKFKTDVDMVTFGNDVWETDHTISDIVSAITVEYL
jgi:hypothetical protein